MGGCNDTEVIRAVIDTSIWLGSIPGYALSETSKGLVDMVMDEVAVEVGVGGVIHFDRPILLPFTLESYDGKYVTSPGRPGIPASVPAWSQADKKKYLDFLISELNEKMLAGLDPEPNLSRSLKRPAMYPLYAAAELRTLCSLADPTRVRCPVPPPPSVQTPTTLPGVDGKLLEKTWTKSSRI
jgi:hypothetical protein